MPLRTPNVRWFLDWRDQMQTWPTEILHFFQKSKPKCAMSSGRQKQSCECPLAVAGLRADCVTPRARLHNFVAAILVAEIAFPYVWKCASEQPARKSSEPYCDKEPTRVFIAFCFLWPHPKVAISSQTLCGENRISRPRTFRTGIRIDWTLTRGVP